LTPSATGLYDTVHRDSIEGCHARRAAPRGRGDPRFGQVLRVRGRRARDEPCGEHRPRLSSRDRRRAAHGRGWMCSRRRAFARSQWHPYADRRHGCRRVGAPLREVLARRVDRGVGCRVRRDHSALARLCVTRPRIVSASLRRCSPRPRNSTTVRALAHALEVTPTTLVQSVRAEAAPSPKALSRRRPASRGAAAMLEDPAASVAAVAALLEYSSPQSFGRHLQLRLQLTPSAFRKSYDGEGMLEHFRRTPRARLPAGAPHVLPLDPAQRSSPCRGQRYPMVGRERPRMIWTSSRTSATGPVPLALPPLSFHPVPLCSPCIRATNVLPHHQAEDLESHRLDRPDGRPLRDLPSASTPATTPPAPRTASIARRAEPPEVITSSMIATRSPASNGPSSELPRPVGLRLFADRECTQRGPSGGRGGRSVGGRRPDCRVGRGALQRARVADRVRDRIRAKRQAADRAVTPQTPIARLLAPRAPTARINASPSGVHCRQAGVDV